MQLLINVGGKGKRLGTLTSELPKPMIRIYGKPVLQYLVEWAFESSFSEVILLCGYKHELIREYFGDGTRFSLPIRYSVESTPLGSGGPIKNARHMITDTFTYISGDLICKVNFEKMYLSHERSKPTMTVLLHESSHPNDSDILCLDEQFRVNRFIGKNEIHGSDCGNLTNAGLCILETKVLDYMQEDVFTFETYLYPRLISMSEHIHGYVSDEVIFDMGTPERLEAAEKILITTNGH